MSRAETQSRLRCVGQGAVGGAETQLEAFPLFLLSICTSLVSFRYSRQWELRGSKSRPYVRLTFLWRAGERLRKCARLGGLESFGSVPQFSCPRFGADWEALQFAVKMLRIVSWNINGIRSPLPGMVCEEPNNCTTMAMGRILDKLDADIICLQETKVTSEHLRTQDSYHTFPFPLFPPAPSHFTFSFLESLP